MHNYSSTGLAIPEQRRKLHVKLSDKDGKVILDLPDVEAPAFWSDRAITIAAGKFFRKSLGEHSVYQLVERVANRIAREALDRGYLSAGEATVFRTDLQAICLGQYASFNSPVWFNVGVPDHPQRASACFILGVDDNMGSIMELQQAEATIFKFGGGAGSNLSGLRSSYETIGDTGSKSSGPLGFMRAFDAWAGTIKSGSIARRAAKMVLLDVNHPDVDKFIASKVQSERLAGVLIAAGYSPSAFDEHSAYSLVPYQNANHSVRVSDAFMQAALDKEDWSAVAKTTGTHLWTMRADVLLRHIAEAAWECGDPGLQFDDTINAWNCSPGLGRINASNPCSEFVYPDNSACNLASLNLMRFRNEDGTLDWSLLRRVIYTLILAQDVLCDFADYPTTKITENSHAYRPLGLGYANLGALLMSMMLPYGSLKAQQITREITSYMTAHAYIASALIAEKMGAYTGWADGMNGHAHLRVLQKHLHAAQEEHAGADAAWNRACELAQKHGLRNAQVTLIAPTGTQGLMMDCDSLGIEPIDALEKTKSLVGGGELKIVPKVAEETAKAMGFQSVVEAATARPDIFQTAMGRAPLHWNDHLAIMAAAQPFLSGAISKTVNMPADATLDDVWNVYMTAWKMGLKTIALYRDGCKQSQPVRVGDGKVAGGKSEAGTGDVSAEAWSCVFCTRDLAGVVAAGDGPLTAMPDNSPGVRPAICDKCLRALLQVHLPDMTVEPELGYYYPRDVIGVTALANHLSRTSQRRRLPDERQAITHKLNIAGHEGYVTVGLYEGGKPGEVFVKMAKEGSTVSGLMDSLGIMISIALQYGIPLEVLSTKLRGTRFEPSGITSNQDIRIASSIVDYLFRWLELKFGKVGAEKSSAKAAEPKAAPPLISAALGNAPPCAFCGDLMTMRAGSCYACDTCGATSGGCS